MWFTNNCIKQLRKAMETQNNISLVQDSLQLILAIFLRRTVLEKNKKSRRLGLTQQQIGPQIDRFSATNERAKHIYCKLTQNIKGSKLDFVNLAIWRTRNLGDGPEQATNAVTRNDLLKRRLDWSQRQLVVPKSNCQSRKMRVNLHHI